VLFAGGVAVLFAGGVAVLFAGGVSMLLVDGMVGALVEGSMDGALGSSDCFLQPVSNPTETIPNATIR